jgi:uroporphyrinogen-III synthase
MASRLIVTRPARDAQRWVLALAGQGVPAEALPLIEIAPMADAGALERLHGSLGRFAALMFVSANAVDHFFASKTALAQSVTAPPAIENIANGRGCGTGHDTDTQAGAGGIAQRFPALRFMAPGPGTAAALRLAGVPQAQIDAPAADAEQFDSEALWEVVGARHWQGQAVLVVRGQGGNAAKDDDDKVQATPGRDWLARQWEAAGATVEFASVYRRRPPVLTAEQQALAQAASRDGSVWLFSSSEAVTHLARLAPADWSQARGIATHPRIAETAGAAGWGTVVTSRPELEDISAAWASIESAAT